MIKALRSPLFSLAGALIFSVTFQIGTAISEDVTAPIEYPASIFGEVTPPQAEEDQDPEMGSDLDFFASVGYQVPDFNVYYNLRGEAAKDILIPDYVKRTGLIPPEDVRIEVAGVYLTGGDFNDMVIYSFLPGDCDTGCLAQVYKTTDGLTWDKVLEFTSLAFAYKSPDGDKPGEVVAVGNEEMESHIYVWNGVAFVEKK